MPLKLAMLGTGTFALPTLRALVESEHSVDLLVTQPDRQGRGHHQHVNPLKELALANGIDVFQPNNIKTDESLEILRGYDIDLYVTAAYGQILSAELLSIPRLGAINLHGSLLPKYRGAAPVQFAVINGELETGVTIFQIEPKLDAGPMLGIVRTPIGAEETAGELHDRLADLAVPTTLEVLTSLDAGTAEFIQQEASEVTLAPKLKKEDGLIDWSRSVRLVDAQIRGVQPWPKPLTYWHRDDQPSVPLIVTAVASTGASTNQSAGTIEIDSTGQMLVACGDGLARILRVKPPGKREISGEEFVRGYPVQSGQRLSQEAE